MDDQENAVFADMPTKGTANDLCAYLVTLVSFTLVVFLSACAVTQSQQEGPVQISPPVYSLYQEGALFQKNKDFDNALKKYHAALEQARLVQDELGIGITLASIGLVHEAAKRFSNAYESNVEAVRYFRKLKNIAFERATLAASGRLLFFLGNHANAIEVFDEVLILDQKRFSQAAEEEKAQILSERGGLHFFRAGSLQNVGRLQDSVQEYRLAAADFLAVGNQRGAGQAFWSAADIALLNLKTPEVAVKLYADAAPLLQAAGQVSNALWARLGLGEDRKSVV